MAAHGMADTQGIGQAESGRDACDVGAEVSPKVRRRGLAAMTVPAGVDRKTVSPVQATDHLIPASSVEPGGVAKEYRRILPGPFPERDLDTVDCNSMLNWHS